MILDAHIITGSHEQANKAIRKLYGWWRKTESPPVLLKENLKKIRAQLLEPSFKLIPSWSLLKSTVNEGLHQLTTNQFQLLDFLKNYKQVKIKGAAGTGKTMLALKKPGN